MSFDFNSLITDRSQADVSRAKDILARANVGAATPDELEELISGRLKGLYDYTDLNRVTKAMTAIDAEFKKLGYESGYEPVVVSPDSGGFPAGPEVPPDPNAPDMYTWSENNSPTISQMEQYLDNVRKLRDVLARIPSVPDVPASMRKRNYQTANDIETILFSIETMIENMKRTINLGWALGISDIGLYGGV